MSAIPVNKNSPSVNNSKKNTHRLLITVNKNSPSVYNSKCKLTVCHDMSAITVNMYSMRIIAVEVLVSQYSENVWHALNLIRGVGWCHNTVSTYGMCLTVIVAVGYPLESSHPVSTFLQHQWKCCELCTWWRFMRLKNPVLSQHVCNVSENVLHVFSCDRGGAIIAWKLLSCLNMSA